MKVRGTVRLGNGDRLELEAEAPTYEAARDALYAQVPEGGQLLFIKADR